MAAAIFFHVMLPARAATGRAAEAPWNTPSRPDRAHIMQPSLEVLMSGASALLSTAMAFGAGITTWHRGPRPSHARRAPARRRVGAYALLEKIAAGAMGEVYRAQHTETGELHAIKLLAPHAGERQRAQFEKEVQFGAVLGHPNLVSVHEHGEARDGTPYFSMDLVDGITLEDLVEREGAQAPRRVLGILLQVAEALGAVHDHGFVHRDVKPSNIVLSCGPDGVDSVKLLDFGLVLDLAEPCPSTSNEHVVGTPLYISPEALTEPSAVDGRSDLYGLGAVAYFLLSGTPVFGGRNVVDVCAHHLLTPPAPLPAGVGGRVSKELEQLVLDCLAKDPAARPGNARELVWRLRLCPELEATPAPRCRRAALEHASDVDARQRLAPL